MEGLPNGQSHWFIDYLPLCLEARGGPIAGDQRELYNRADTVERDRMRNEAFWRDCRQWAQTHADAIVRAYAETSDVAVRAKYEWLAGYHNDAITRFFGKDISSELRAVIDAL